MKMGRAYDFLAKWTKIDDLLAPYNAAIFDKIAAYYGRRWMAVAAAFGAVMLCASIVAVCFFIFDGSRRVYLIAMGIETKALVTDVVLDPPSGLRSSRMAEVSYRFTASNGEVISGAIRRELWEVKEAAAGIQIAVLYAERWPWINLPRFGFKNSGLIAFMGLLFSGVSTHLILFLLKYRIWRRRGSARAA